MLGLPQLGPRGSPGLREQLWPLRPCSGEGLQGPCPVLGLRSSPCSRVSLFPWEPRSSCRSSSGGAVGRTDACPGQSPWVRGVTVSNAARPGEGLRLHPSLTFVRSNLPLVFSLCVRVRLPVAYWPIKIKTNVTGNDLMSPLCVLYCFPLSSSLPFSRGPWMVPPLFAVKSHRCIKHPTWAGAGGASTNPDKGCESPAPVAVTGAALLAQNRGLCAAGAAIPTAGSQEGSFPRNSFCCRYLTATQPASECKELLWWSSRMSWDREGELWEMGTEGVEQNVTQNHRAGNGPEEQGANREEEGEPAHG